MNFDITGQKAYMKHGPHQNRMGIIKRGIGHTEYTLVIGDAFHIDVALNDLVLVDVDLKAFHDWCEQNGYL
ncbi:DUF3912 family protein [Microbacteriaceae bacterium 4G12]